MTAAEAEPTIFERIAAREIPANIVAETSRVIAFHDIAADLADGDFRLVFNTGAAAGQTVFHVHAHVLAGGLEEASLGG